MRLDAGGVKSARFDNPNEIFMKIL